MRNALVMQQTVERGLLQTDRYQRWPVQFGDMALFTQATMVRPLAACHSGTLSGSTTSTTVAVVCATYEALRLCICSLVWLAVFSDCTALRHRKHQCDGSARSFQHLHAARRLPGSFGCQTVLCCIGYAAKAARVDACWVMCAGVQIFRCADRGKQMVEKNRKKR